MVAPPESVVDYIPAVFDQVLVLDVDQELRDVALMSNDLEDKETFVGLLNSLEEVVVYQGSTPDAVHNVLIMQGNEQFSIDEVAAMGLLVADDTYDYKALWEEVWAYGSAEWIAYMESALSKQAINDDSFRVFDRARRSGKYNVWFFSRPVLWDQVNPIAAQFAQRLEYTYLLSHINSTEPSGRLTMQLADWTIQSGWTPLASKIVSKLADTPWFFIEMSDILSIVWVDKAQLQLFAPTLLAQVGAWSWIDADDITAIGNALEWNVAIVLTPSLLSPAQLWGHIVFEDPELFTTLQKLSPAMRGLVDMITGWAELMQLEEVITENELIYAVTTGTGDESISFPLVQLSKNPDNTTLSVLAEWALEYSDAGSIDIPTLTEETRMLFGWDAWLLQQNFLQAQIAQSENAAQQLFQTWSVHWVVDILPNDQQVHIEFFTTK